MSEVPYHALASVYEWLVPEALLEPEGAVAAFAAQVDALPPSAAVLDCSAGTGELAVGLALRGLDVTATDASPAMIERTRALAAGHGVAVDARACAWEELPGQGWDERFAAVFCVGNSLAHAAGPPGRRVALRAMAGVLAGGGLLAVTSRNWELERAAGTRLDVDEELTHRGDATGLVARAWTIAEDWDAQHGLDIAVAVLGEGDAVTTVRERLVFWPFAPETLEDELRAAGLTPESSTYSPGAARYLVVARR
jgi:SAM-dependent methyltransferase